MRHLGSFLRKLQGGAGASSVDNAGCRHAAPRAAQQTSGLHPVADDAGKAVGVKRGSANQGTIDVSFRLEEDAQNAYWGGQIVPRVVILQFSKK